MSDADKMSPTERAWLDFLRANNPAHAPEPALRLVQILMRICQLRRG